MTEQTIFATMSQFVMKDMAQGKPRSVAVADAEATIQAMMTKANELATENLPASGIFGNLSQMVFNGMMRGATRDEALAEAEKTMQALSQKTRKLAQSNE